ncbi:YkgJ family cysteine cluster protein [Lacrimispora amygdalina]|uniref:YkgJ family cysteine cluster protein n=1 Tax=Lacrimispora amygdalina TaxID=253257 RepID=UPI000BE440B7|nr:YkgJ family cysteine cluster protein [Lacrimispora amygdalina]
MSSFTQDPVNLGAKNIEIDDPFHFYCDGCGNCCRGRNNLISGTEIFLSGPDVWRIMDHTKLTFEKLLEKNINVNFDPDLKLNLCSLKFRYDGSCTFLRKGRCMVYDVRPRTCALYPLGRAILFHQIGKQIVHYKDDYVINGMEPGYQCNFGSDEKYTVTEWLQKNSVPIEDTEDIKWYQRMAEYSDRANRKTLQKSELEKIFYGLYAR